jgi:hypothetical protein
MAASFGRVARTAFNNFMKITLKRNTVFVYSLAVLLSILIIQPNYGMCEDVLNTELARCWNNTNKQKTYGNIRFICFKDTEINITFWTPSGGLDYSEENWHLKSDAEFMIDEDVCEFEVRSELLYIKKCKASGVFSKN